MILSTLYFILVLTIVVFIHELGHYLVAKLCGVKIEEFSIGFGTKLFGWKRKNGELWKVSLLPFGGYVKMYGDDNASGTFGYKENPTEEELKYCLAYKHPLKKIFVASAGPLMNLLLAVVLFFSIFSTKGVVKILPVITSVEKNSIAEKIGIRANDKILSINGYKIEIFKDVRKALDTITGDNIEVKIARNAKNKHGKDVEEMLYLKGKYTAGAILGILGGKTEYTKVSLRQAIIASFHEVYDICSSSGRAFGNIFLKHKTKNIGGPITIAKQSVKAGKQGVNQLLYFIALISMSLGVINIMPIPLLDGGHVLFSFIELTLRKRIPNRIYKIAMYMGIVIVGFLMILGFFNDIFIHR